jgi:hypothetical protein
MTPLSAGAGIAQWPLGRGFTFFEENPAHWPDIADERRELARWRSPVWTGDRLG